MGPVWTYVRVIAVALFAGCIWTGSASAVSVGLQGCPGSHFPYLSEFSFPVAAEGFADDCTVAVGTAVVDVRSGSPEVDVIVADTTGDTIDVDSQGRLTHFRTPFSNIFDLVHPAGVIGSVTIGGTQSTLSYSAAGRLTQIAAATGNISVSYNAAGLISGIAFPTGTENFGYSDGRLTSFSDSGGDTGTLTYDTSGRLTKVVMVVTQTDPTQTFSYDAGGSVLTWTNADPLTQTLTYSHNAGGDVTLVKNGMNVDATLAYAAPHKLSAVTGPGNAPVASFAYDTSGRLSQAQGPLSLESFSYNSAGLLSSTLETSKTTSFSYDALARLSGWTNPDMSTVAIAYLPGPDSTTGGSTSVRSNTATLTGSVNPQGAPTTYRFEYGTTTAYGHATRSVTLSAGTQPISVVDELRSLKPGTTYHYRLLATNRNGSATGRDRTLHTQVIKCHVPRLKGDTLTQAKRALTRAHCQLGRVHRPRQVPKGAKLTVSSQNPAAGAVRKAGAKVSIKLTVGR
jgi:YD repeat-containing protein